MSHPINHILVVDDDTRIRDLLGQYLQDHGFFVTTAKDAAQAREKLKQFVFDLMVVDVMMPGELGTELTASLRKTMNVPILMLTAMGETEDRISGLESGADDYLAKPFEPRELLLRIQSILQRTAKVKLSESLIHFGPFTFDNSSGNLSRDHQDVTLTSNEVKLFKALIDKAGNIVSREALASACGGINERSVDVQITRLRNKIEPDPKKPKYLKTIRGAGYVMYTK